MAPRRVVLLLLVLAAFVFAGTGCRNKSSQKETVRPRTLRDVPAQRLAFQFTADTDSPPSAGSSDDANAILPSVQSDFDTRRPNDALLRTALSPDRQRAFAIYATAEDEPNEFRMDIYGVSGDFQRQVTPAGMAVVFASVASWSPDGNFVAFIGYTSSKPQPSPTPVEDMPGSLPEIPTVTPTASPTPIIGSTVPLYKTEQIYICNRDGFDLRPLTTREGLIYFYLAWAPDSHALAALACKENEWRDRPLLPSGRPRLLGIDGGERLLDDALTDVLPVWSPDASKVATAVETDVKIFDALNTTPTQASIPLREALLSASRVYDEKEAAKTKKNDATGSETSTSSNAAPISFNPIVTLEWPQPETLFLQTGYVRNYENEQRRTWMRWHMLRLSAQAAILG